MTTTCETSDLLVFSHLRWDFIYRRPHHLLSRFACHRRVFYFEEPVFGMTEMPRLHIKETAENVLIIIPYLPSHIEPQKVPMAMKELVDELIYEEELLDFTAWYYSPKAFEFSNHLEPRVVVYDCLDNFSGDKREESLINESDLIITSCSGLFEKLKRLHPTVHYIPCSLDSSHFSQGREKLIEPDDQISVSKPRVGFYGVIDQEFDFDLLVKASELRPHYQFMIAGPVVGLDTRTLPRRGNIQYLGKKDYHALPLYLAGWDLTIFPMKTQSHLRQISAVKVFEFLAAGKPVISTRHPELINSDVSSLVTFCDSAEELARMIDENIQMGRNEEWLKKVDLLMAQNSWDQTFMRVSLLEMNIIKGKIEQAESLKIVRPVNLSSSGVAL